VRDYLQLTRNVSIFIQSKVALNTLKEQVADKVEPALSKEEREGKKPIPRLQTQLCKEYFDIRMFGAVLATGEEGARLNGGQVRGPVQLTFGRSIDPVLPLDLTITRQARTTEERMETGTTEMGRKPIVPYGLYRAHGYFNPFLAQSTGVSADDLTALWDALHNLFDYDRSAARGEMAVRGLWVFTHDNEKGNAPTHKLFELIKTPPVGGSPRSFEDYQKSIEFPEPGSLEAHGFTGVTLDRLV
jgi:CRISPR-associated protein Csd2